MNVLIMMKNKCTLQKSQLIAFGHWYIYDSYIKPLVIINVRNEKKWLKIRQVTGISQFFIAWIGRVIFFVLNKYCVSMKNIDPEESYSIAG